MADRKGGHGRAPTSVEVDALPMRRRLSSRDQVTVPAEVRSQLSLGSGTSVEFELWGTEVVVPKATMTPHPVDQVVISASHCCLRASCVARDWRSTSWRGIHSCHRLQIRDAAATALPSLLDTGTADIHGTVLAHARHGCSSPLLQATGHPMRAWRAGPGYLGQALSTFPPASEAFISLGPTSSLHLLAFF